MAANSHIGYTVRCFPALGSRKQRAEMNIRLTADQRALRETLDRLLAERCPLLRVRALEAGAGHDPAVWAELARVGALGLLVPEARGGSGGTFLEAALCCEAFGAALYPSPFIWSCVVAPFLLEQPGAEQAAAAWLPRVATGEAIITLADDRAHVFDAARPTLQPERGGWRLSGTAQFVEYAPLADALLAAAEGPEGPALLLIAPTAAALTMERRHEVSGGQYYRVVFDAAAPAGQVLPVPWTSLESAYDRARIALAARMVGAAQRVFDLTLGYLRERSQFGQPLITFQALNFRLAALLTKIDAARLLAYEAAWRIDAGQPLANTALLAKARAAEVYREMAAEAIQLHGGFGFTEEANPQLFYRRAAVEAFLLGTPAALRERAAV
jgi:alkylation response protein AidB-like acyl-CoA dehydrogenase